MKIRIKDRRDLDTQLKRGAMASVPSQGFDQRVVNFVKKLSINPIETNRISDVSDKTKVTRYITNKFVAENPNLRQRYGLIFSIIDRYFDYEIINDLPKDEVKIETQQTKPKTHTQLDLTFEQFYNSIFEKYRN